MKNISQSRCKASRPAATVQAILNLIPGSVWTPQGDIANDGLGMIRSFTQPLSYYADMIGQTYVEQEEEWPEDDAEEG